MSRSGYHKWRTKEESVQAKRKKELSDQIMRIYETSRKVFGCPKIFKILERRGVSVSKRTVSRYRKEMEIRSITTKKYKATTNSNHSLPVCENLLQQNFQAEKPNEKWVTDITYISTDEGWLYVASVMDLYSRKIVGWHADKRMTKELVITALDREYLAQKPGKGLLHHSDQGSQYASLDYKKRLETYQMVGSMSRRGNGYDNAVIEAFHSVIKRELIHLNHYRTRKQAERDIFWYMEAFYNRERIHSTIDSYTPAEYEARYDAAQRAAAI